MSDDATPPPDAAPLLPYASGMHYPAEPGSSADGAVFREGPIIICLNGTTLPARCILCGDHGAGTPIRLTVTWDSSFRLTRVSRGSAPLSFSSE